MRYFVTVGSKAEEEVSKEEFIRMERVCGFHSKFGPTEVATGGFTASFNHDPLTTIKGRVVYPEINRE